MTLYALEPGVALGDDLDRAPVLQPLEHGGDYLADAAALWQLVDDRRAEGLREFLARSEADAEATGGHPRWDTAELWELVGLLTGVEDALQHAGIVDASWMIAPEHARDLARRVPGMDVRPERPAADLQHALAEVIARVHGLRTFLTNAADAGASVELA